MKIILTKTGFIKLCEFCNNGALNSTYEETRISKFIALSDTCSRSMFIVTLCNYSKDIMKRRLLTAQ